MFGNDPVFWVFIKGVEGMVLSFQEPKAGMVAMQFLIEQAKNQGVAQLTEDLKQIEWRLQCMNS